MSSVVHKETYRNCDIEVWNEDGYDGMSPREWDNLGVMLCFHRRYELGDENIDSTTLYGKEWKNIDHAYTGWESDADEAAEHLEEYGDEYVFLPVYMYDHSGVSLSTGNSSYPYNCPWDSGQLGWIVVSKAKIREEYGVKRVSGKLAKKVEEILRNEVKTYSMWLQGRVYGFTTYNDGEMIDSCGGYYPGDNDEYEWAVKEAKESIDYHWGEMSKRNTEAQIVLTEAV